jgi:hypothetical protein
LICISGQVFECADGYKYEGEWLGNQKHGRGTCTFPNGDVYDGEWESDKASGKGVFIKPNGNRFDGLYRNDKSNGWGVYEFANGDRFEGQWRDGLKTGTGSIAWADGRQFEGTFSQDCPVSGELTEKDGSVHTVVYDGKTTFGRGAEPLSKMLILSADEAKKSGKSKLASGVASGIKSSSTGRSENIVREMMERNDDWDMKSEERSDALQAKLEKSPEAWEEMIGRVGLERGVGSGPAVRNSSGSKNFFKGSSSWFPAEFECPLSHEMMSDPGV